MTDLIAKKLYEHYQMIGALQKDVENLTKIIRHNAEIVEDRLRVLESQSRASKP